MLAHVRIATKKYFAPPFIFYHSHSPLLYLFFFAFFFSLLHSPLLSADEPPHYAFTVALSPLSGGETTIFNTSRDAFAKPLANLPTSDLRDFAFGNKIFNTNWIQAPASVASLDGLGPTFNRVSCSGCHFKDGRGRPPHSPSEPMRSMLLRLSYQASLKHKPIPHPNYGEQLNTLAIHHVPAEGKASVTYTLIHGKYRDGTSYTLRKPTYHFSDMAFDDIDRSTTLISPRVSPAVFGLGLLEAIPPATLQDWADPKDSNNDGISGRINYITDPTGNKVIGRFGWKANVTNLLQQNAGAALGDIGLTSSLHPKENCPLPQKACQKAISGGSPELSDQQLQKLTFYTQTLAPPARREVRHPAVLHGAKLFSQHGCASCHIPQVKTGSHAIPQLSKQLIQPFTDLLLHDMGEELADHRPDHEATGREWRTPPLWGIGLVETVNQHTHFLHDGRARNLEEAILWHNGEALSSKEAFIKMSLKERKALLRFLRSL